jgi:hypothetical protein
MGWEFKTHACENILYLNHYNIQTCFSPELDQDTKGIKATEPVISHKVGDKYLNNTK